MAMNRSYGARWLIPLVAALALLVLPVSAEQPGSGRVVTMAIHGGNVSFSPAGSFDKMTLTVGGGDYVFTQELGAGQSTSFAPVDRRGDLLPDGVYKWEIVVSPRLEGLRAVTSDSPDGRKLESPLATRGPRQSGVFTIRNGAIVDSSLTESESPRQQAGLTPEASVPPSAAARLAEQTDRDGS